MSEAATHRVERDGRRRDGHARPPGRAQRADARVAARARARPARALGATPRVRCVVLTGAGRAFCAGQDLREEGALDDVDDDDPRDLRPDHRGARRDAEAGDRRDQRRRRGRRALVRARLRHALPGRGRRADDGVLEHRARARLAAAPGSCRASSATRAPSSSRATGRRVRSRRGARARPRAARAAAATSCCRPRTSSPRALAARPTLALAWTKRLLRAARGAHARRRDGARGAAAGRGGGDRTITPRASPRSSRSASRASRDADGVAPSAPAPDRQPGRLRREGAHACARRCARSRRAATSSSSRPSTAGTRRELAREAVARGFDGVVAMGGDGTANEVLNGAGDALPSACCRPAARACCRARSACRATSARAARVDRRRARRRPRAHDQPRHRQRPALRLRLRRSAPTRRPCASSTTRAGRRAGGPATPTSRRRSCARCCAATSASRSSRCSIGGRGRRARRQRVRRQRASVELRRAVRAQARPARDVRGRPRRRRAERHAPPAPAALRDAAARHGQPGLPHRPPARLPARRRRACASRAAGRCRCTPTATISATSRRRSSASSAMPRGSSRDAALLFDLDGTLVDSRVVVERHWARVLRAPRPRLRRRARGAARRAQRRHDPRRRAARSTPRPRPLLLDEAEEVDTDGLVVVRRRRPRCWPGLPEGRWGIVTSGHRALAERPPARRRAAGPGRDGVR